MKKLIALAMAIIVACLGLAVGSHRLSASTGDTGRNVLNLANWGDYIDPKLITKFERETGYHVNLETFDSNEGMYTKIKQGGTDYDLTVPSEYMVAKMRKEGLLLKLDRSRLHGLHNFGSAS